MLGHVFGRNHIRTRMVQPGTILLNVGAATKPVTHTKLHSKDNAAARRRLRRRIIDAWPLGYTLRKPTPYEGARDDANKVSQGIRLGITVFTGAPYTSNHKIVQWPYMDLIKKKKLPFLPVLAEPVVHSADQGLFFDWPSPLMAFSGSMTALNCNCCFHFSVGFFCVIIIKNSMS